MRRMRRRGWRDGVGVIGCNALTDWLSPLFRTFSPLFCAVAVAVAVAAAVAVAVYVYVPWVFKLPYSIHASFHFSPSSPLLPPRDDTLSLATIENSQRKLTQIHTDTYHPSLTHTLLNPHLRYLTLSTPSHHHCQPTNQPHRFTFDSLISR